MFRTVCLYTGGRERLCSGHMFILRDLEVVFRTVCASTLHRDVEGCVQDSMFIHRYVEGCVQHSMFIHRDMKGCVQHSMFIHRDMKSCVQDSMCIHSDVKGCVQDSMCIHRNVKGCVQDSMCIHRDVKGSNILLTSTGEIKLVDYGISCQVCFHRQTFLFNAILILAATE